MTTPRSVHISLPQLSDTEAYHLVGVIQELLIIVDSYYAEPIHRYRQHQDTDPCDHCPIKFGRDPLTIDDPIPF